MNPKMTDAELDEAMAVEVIVWTVGERYYRACVDLGGCRLVWYAIASRLRTL